MHAVVDVRTLALLPDTVKPKYIQVRTHRLDLSASGALDMQYIRYLADRLGVGLLVGDVVIIGEHALMKVDSSDWRRNTWRSTTITADQVQTRLWEESPGESLSLRVRRP